MQRYYAVAEGQVQGVGFRYFACSQALTYQLSGWVRNMSNGMVEMEVQGQPQSLQLFFKALQQGNRFIKVRSLSCREIDPLKEENGFHVRYF